MTAAEFLTLPDSGRRQELLAGRHFVYSSPGTRHQQISMRLLLALHDPAAARGQLFIGRLDVVLSDFDVVQPDLMYVADERAHIVTAANIQGAPDLVVEIAGEDTRAQDRVVKRATYERHGVAEYWIIDPDANTTSVYRRAGGRFVPAAPAEPLTTPLLPGFAIPLDQLFA
jgi:Uma2 family endonuclease